MNKNTPKLPNINREDKQKISTNEGKRLFSPGSFGIERRNSNMSAFCLKIGFKKIQKSFPICWRGKYTNGFILFNCNQVVKIFKRGTIGTYQQPFLSMELSEAKVQIKDRNYKKLKILVEGGGVKLSILSRKDFIKIVYQLRIRSIPFENIIREQCENRYYRTNRTSFWSSQKVLEWSKQIYVDGKFKKTLHDVAGMYFKENDICGKTMLGWEDSEIRSFVRSFVCLGSQRRILIRKLLMMIQEGCFDMSFFLVQKKIVNMLQEKGIYHSVRDVNNLAKKFSQLSCLEDQILGYLCPKKQTNNKVEGEERLRDDDLFFRVKLNIVENISTEKMKKMRRRISRLLEFRDSLCSGLISDEGSSTRFGLFHASISIGDLQLEWVDSGLVIIRPVGSIRAILSCDVGTIHVPDLDVFVLDLSKEIQRWNSHMKYDNMKTNDKIGNCQSFVQKMLEHIGIKTMMMDKGVENCIKRMKHRGVSNKQFQFSKEFAKVFFKKKDKGLFNRRLFEPKSHEELDLFVSYLFRRCKCFETKYPSEFAILKSLDRAFWLQYRAEKVMNKGFYPVESYFAPLNVRRDCKGEMSSDCPFSKLM